MAGIIQNYKNYRTAKKAQKNLELDLERYLKSIVKPISLSKFEEYNHQFEMFTTCADSVYKDKGENALKEYMKEKAPLVHAPSCFCIVSVGFYLRPGSILEAIVALDIVEKERDKKIKEKDIIRCLHNHENGLIDENCCSNCPAERFRDLAEYQSLRGQYTDAQKATALAKQTLLAHFSLIKQKSSH